MQIEISNIWAMVFAIVVGMVILRLVDLLFGSIATILDRTVVKTIEKLWYRKGGIHDTITKQANSKSKESKTIGFRDRHDD